MAAKKSDKDKDSDKKSGKSRRERGAQRFDGRPLRALDMDRRIDSDRYEPRLLELQVELRRVQQAYLKTGQNAVLVFEGWDAAGKGGAIRRIASALDPRSLKVWPIAAPREYFKERHYMARFWEKLPPRSGIAIFDRSWYGRVMVERVEGFATEDEWSRAYDEINEFERLLVADGTRIVKFFLHVTPEEQLKRFEKRLMDPLKRWKLSYEDFRNRGKWKDYEEAIEDMLRETSTGVAPWTLVPANSKQTARIDIMETIVEELARDVDLSPPPLDATVLEAAREMFDLDDGQWEKVKNGD